MPAKEMTADELSELEKKSALFKIRATRTILLIVGLLAVPAIILISMGYGVCFGVQSGAEAGLKQASRMLKEWKEIKP